MTIDTSKKVAAWAVEAETLRIPQLHLPPLPTDTTWPDAGDRPDRLDTDLATWAHLHGLTNSDEEAAKLARRKYGYLAAMCFPDSSWDATRVLTQFFMYGFEVDDHYLEPRPGRSSLQVHIHLMRLHAAVTHAYEPTTDNDPAVRALRSITIEFDRLATPRVSALFKIGWYRFFLGIACENSFAAAGLPPTPSEYLHIRLLTVGAFTESTVQFAGGFEIPTHLIRHLSLSAFNTAAHHAISYSNDIMSHSA